MAKTTTRTRRTTTMEERAAKVAALAERYTTFADSLDETQRGVYAARFDHYSARNALLIVMQMPEATIVRGIHGWKDEGRRVRKGEHGIQILAPAGRYEISGSAAKDTSPQGEQGEQGKQGKKTEVRQMFRMAYVFDISQTDPV